MEDHPQPFGRWAELKAAGLLTSAGLAAFDLLTFTVAGALLLAAGFLALFRGVRAAVHTDPAAALNSG